MICTKFRIDLIALISDMTMRRIIPAKLYKNSVFFIPNSDMTFDKIMKTISNGFQNTCNAFLYSIL